MDVRLAGVAAALTTVVLGAPGPGAGLPHQPAGAAAHRTWFVNGVHGSNRNNCRSPGHACRTITHAIALSGPGDAIVVAAATYPENLTITHSLTVTGAGAAKTIINGGGVASEIINEGRRAAVTVSGVTLTGGGGAGDGGGVYNCESTLTIADSVIAGNNARRGSGALGYGGGTYNCPGSILTIVDTTYRGNTAEAGGAICNGGILTIADSTFRGNVAHKRRGGAIFNYGTLTVVNSTFTGNRVANGAGGAIHNGALFGQRGTLTISSSTVSRNTAGRAGGVFNSAGGRVTVQDTIVSGNAGGNCGGMLASAGYNLSSDGTCAFHGPGDMNSTGPRLAPLRDNGGPTQTMALRPGSPAVDAGNPAGCTDGHGHLLHTDQRGEPRPDPEDTGGCDIGAYESQGG